MLLQCVPEVLTLQLVELCLSLQGRDEVKQTLEDGWLAFDVVDID